MAQVAAAAAIVSLVTSGYSAFEQAEIADESANQQREQVRQQQVQLRLQENQSSIERLKSLRSTLATNQVLAEARNISPSSGTARSIIQQSFNNFMEDESVESLNYAGKQASLETQLRQINTERGARVFNAVSGFGKEVASVGLSYGKIPSQSLIDYSANATTARRAAAAASNFNINKRFY